MKKRMKRLMVLVLLFCVVFTGLGLDFSYAYATESVIDTEFIEDTEEIENNDVTLRTEVIEETKNETSEVIEEEVEPEVSGWRVTTAERKLYYDDFTKENIGKKYQGETILELLQMNEELGIDWESFFEGTCLAGTDLEGLQWLQAEGYTLESLIKEVSDAGKGSIWHHIYGIETFEAYANQTVTFTGTTGVGHIPACGKENAPVYKMSIGGKAALCADCGKHMYSGTNLTYQGEVTDEYIIKALVYANSGGDYEYAQMYIWAYGDKTTFCTAYAQYKYSLAITSFTYDQIAALTTSNSMFNQFYNSAIVEYGKILNTNISGYMAFMYSNGNSAYQRLYSLFRSTTLPDTPSTSTEPVYETVTAYASAYATADVTMTITKIDAETGKGLGNVRFSLSKDGVYEADIITNSNGVASYTYHTTYSASDSGSATYCSNYDSLTEEVKATVTGYTSYGDAYSDAYDSAYYSALASANSQKEDTSHSYTTTETVARTGYYRNQAQSTIAKTITGDGTISETIRNTRTVGDITITKEDAETGNVAQGDATLEGAVYGLYARSDIVHPDGHTGVLYKAGTLVAEFPATDAQQQASLSNLYLGEYYVKEITPSTGYLLDERSYNVTLSYPGQNQATVSVASTVIEDVIKGNIRLVKHLQENDPSLAYKPQIPEEGAEFDVILKSSGVVYAHIVTDEDGYAQASMLPYGTYIVRQTKGKAGYAFVNDFEVFIKAHERTYSYILENLNYTAQLQIMKKDAVSGEPVAIEGTEFEVYTADGQKVVQKILYPSKYEISTFVTGANGIVCLPEWLAGGEYFLREVKVPYGYTLHTEDIPFKVARENEVKDEWGDSVIQVICENQPVQGELILEVTGEKLAGYNSSGFLYQDIPLGNVAFSVYAAEDILSPDNQTEDNGKRVVLYEKDELVATITTDENGMVVLEDIPLGEYYIVESQVPERYSRDKQSFSVQFEYMDEYTPVIEKSFQIKIERQKLDASVYKGSSEDGRAVSGAVIGMYATEDILDDDGSIIVKKDTLIEKQTTNGKGTAKFIKQYPIGKYYAKEISAPSGYVYSGDAVHFTFNYQGQEVEKVTLTETIYNAPIPSGGLYISKSTVQMTQPGDSIKYTIDAIGNGASVYVNDFTLTDFVPTNTTLTTLWTGTYSAYRSYSVSFKTNKNAEWQLWAEDLNSFENNRLDAATLGLKRGERVTEFKFEFGRVRDGFFATTNPCYMVYVNNGLSSKMTLKSSAQLTGTSGGETYFVQADTMTTIWTGPEYEERKEVVKVDSIPKLPSIEEFEGTTTSPDIQIIPGTETAPEPEQEVEEEKCTCECTFWNCWKLRVAILIGLFMQISGGLMMYVAVKLRKKEKEYKKIEDK